MIWAEVLTGPLSWVVQVFAVVLAVLLSNFVLFRLLARLRRRVERTETPWDDAIIHALWKPLRVIVWIVGLGFAVQIIQRETEAAAIFQAVEPVRDVGVVTVIAWFLVRLVQKAEENLIAAREAAGKEIDRTTADAVAKLVRVAIIISAALVIIQTLGFSISGVLAFGGIGGIAVGFAAKDILANFLGALFLFLDRPFEVGDWIRSPDQEIEGTVEEIGWRLTRIRTFDKRPLYVPNGLFTTMAVENPSRMSRRRIKETIGLRYDDVGKMHAITAAVREMLVAHPDIDESQTLMVNFNSFAPSSLDFFIYTFTHTTVWTDFHCIKQDVLLKITEIIAAHGAEIAFPTSTVLIPEPVTVRDELRGSDPDV
jgi:MscS family membrane protein